MSEKYLYIAQLDIAKGLSVGRLKVLKETELTFTVEKHTYYLSKRIMKRSLNTIIFGWCATVVCEEQTKLEEMVEIMLRSVINDKKEKIENAKKTINNLKDYYLGYFRKEFDENEQQKEN